MPRHLWKLNPIERSMLESLATIQQRAERDMIVAFTALCASRDVADAQFRGFEGDMLVVETPEPSKPELVK